MPKAKKTDKQRIYILDTNIFMADPDCMNRFGKHMIVVPDMVIEELDDNKKASGDKGYNTRQSLRNFDSLRRKGNLIKGVRITIMLYCLQAGKISRIIESCKLQKG